MNQAFNFSPEPLDPKYNVFRIDDIQNTDPFPQGEFFVLLKKDALAIHALWSYVGVLRVAYELVKDDEEAEALNKLSERVAGLATTWQINSSDTKLPD